MKTAISVPDRDFERFERIATLHGMNRSEFYRLAGARLADELEGASDLTRIANDVLARSATVVDDDLFVHANEERLRDGADW